MGIFLESYDTKLRKPKETLPNIWSRKSPRKSCWHRGKLNLIKKLQIRPIIPLLIQKVSTIFFLFFLFFSSFFLFFFFSFFNPCTLPCRSEGYIGQPEQHYQMKETLCFEMYKQYFVDQDHEEYLASDSPLGPLSLSFSCQKQETDWTCRIILRTSEVDLFSSFSLPIPLKRSSLSPLQSLSKILSFMVCMDIKLFLLAQNPTWKMSWRFLLTRLIFSLFYFFLASENTCCPSFFRLRLFVSLLPPFLFRIFRCAS